MQTVFLVSKSITVTVTTLFILTLSSNAQAGWLDKLKDFRDSVREKTPSSSSNNKDDIAAGLKEALRVGSQKSIKGLSKPNGFLHDPKVKIPLPDQLDRFAKLMERLGQKKQVTQFVTTLNRAAEKSVSVTGQIFVDAIREMTITDAIKIFRGRDDEATRYFRKTAGKSLYHSIKPIVTDSTSEVGVTKQYKNLRAKGGTMGELLVKNTPDLDDYITQRTIDGLFVKIAEQEVEIRKNPKARTTELLKKVFGR